MGVPDDDDLRLREPPGDGQVLALRFAGVSDAERLAAWCGGSVEVVELEAGGLGIVVWVPTPRGPRPLEPGMWVKQLPDGTFAVDTAEDFLARHERA